MERTVIALLAMLWALPSLTLAQTVTAYPFKVCTQGQPCTTPVTTYAIPAAEVQCGQPKTATPTGTVSNPRYVIWNDPASPTTADCRWDSGTTSGPLFALPFSSSITYDAIIQAVNAAGPSPESARSNPFNRPGSSPVALTGLRVTGS